MNLRSHVRSGARSLLRPAWLIVWRRIEARIRSMPMAPQGSDDAWRQHMPAFLNAVSTVGAFGHELAELRKETQARLAIADASLAELSRQLETLLPLRTEIAALQSRHTDLQRQLPATAERLARVEAKAEETRAGLARSLDAAARQTAQENEITARHAALEHEVASRHGGLQEEVGKIASRIEFVRREILYEMKYGANPAAAASGEPPNGETPPSPLQPRILSTAKLAAAREQGLRVNLGCGHIPLDDYINIDRRALPGVDIVAEAGHLPLEPGTLRELRSAHLLEHFPQEELRRRLLPYWHSLLAPGGTFRAVVPDGEAMVAHLAAGDYPFEQFREVLFGTQEYDGDFHFNLFEPRSLQALLEEAGFADADVPVRGRRNGLCYELEINARRP